MLILILDANILNMISVMNVVVNSARFEIIMS